MNFLKRLALLYALVAVTLNSCVNDEKPWELPLGAHMPEFSIELNDGSTVTDRDLAGMPSLIIFFDPFCSDCRRELPLLCPAVRTSGIRCICISRSGTQEQIEEMWQELELDMPHASGAYEDVYHRFASSGVPRAFIFSPSQTLTLSATENLSPIILALNTCTNF